MARMAEWITSGERPLPVFVSSFAKSASGSSSKDDDADDDEDDEDDEEDEDDPDEDKDEDELRAELKAVRASLSAAGGSVKSKRDRIKKLTRELNEARAPKPAKKKAAGDADDEIDVDEIRETAKREGESAGLARAKRAEAKAELLAAGVSRDKIALALRNVDLEDMDLDDEGLDGIDDAIAELRTALPALFVKKRTRRESVAGDGDRDGRDTSSKRKPKTASEIAAARVLGRSS